MESVTLLITFSINLQKEPQRACVVLRTYVRTSSIKAKIDDGVMKKGRRKSHLLVTLARIEPKRSPYIRFKTLSAGAGKEKKGFPLPYRLSPMAKPTISSKSTDALQSINIRGDQLVRWDMKQRI